MFIKTVFKSLFCLAYVLFVAMSAVYHTDEVFGVAVDMIRDGASLTSGRKCVIGAPVMCWLCGVYVVVIGYVVAGGTVIATSKGSLGGIGLYKSTQV